jgi:hypothetical protein
MYYFDIDLIWNHVVALWKVIEHQYQIDVVVSRVYP